MLLPSDWIDCALVDIASLAPLEEIEFPPISDHGVRMFIKRDDLLHPFLGGNKIYKLHTFLNHHRHTHNSRPIATFGGAYSNHIAALAAAGQQLGINTVGIIRGQRPARLSATLLDAESFGMQLNFVSRADYRRRQDMRYIAELEARLGNCYWIPEGGAGHMGVSGCVALAEGVLASCERSPDCVFHACGTGTSLAGLALGFARAGSKVHTYGVSVLKGGEHISTSVDHALRRDGTNSDTWSLLPGYHWGGYAKFPRELALFMQDFESTTRVTLDPVYTAKLMWSVVDRVKNGALAPSASVVVVHSGGLQGRRWFGLDFHGEYQN